MTTEQFYEKAFHNERQAREMAEDLLLQRTREVIHLQAKLKQSQDTLIHSEKMATLGQMAANTVHEINNPIGYLISNIDRLKDYAGRFNEIMMHYKELKNKATEHSDLQNLCQSIDSMTDEKDMEFVLQDSKAIIQESKEGLFLIRNLASVLRNFSHFHDSGLQKVNINECIERAIKFSSFELKFKANVHKSLSPLPTTYCYPDPLTQAFTNLLINASQAIQTFGEVWIRSSVSDNKILIEIEDNGTGIKEENLRKLFSPFFTTKPAGIGTGLGLSITHDIIANHRGFMTVRTKENVGTTFSIYLPIMLSPSGISQETKQ